MGNSYNERQYRCIWKEEYIKIFTSQRSFAEGPGGNSPYGGDQIAKMIGICTLERQNGEKRACKASYAFMKFTLLQKINNIVLQSGSGERKLNDEERKIIADLGLTVGTDYKGQTLYTGSLIKLEVLSGTTRAESSAEINNGGMTLKLDSSTGTKGVKITASANVTLTIQLNGNGDKNVQIAKADGTLIKEISVSKSATNVETIITLNEGESIIVYAKDGGGRFVGVVATKENN